MPFIPLVLTLISVGVASLLCVCSLFRLSRDRRIVRAFFSFPFAFLLWKFSSPLATHFDDRHTHGTREIGNIAHNENSANHNSNRLVLLRMAAQLLRCRPVGMRRRRILLVASMAGWLVCRNELISICDVQMFVYKRAMCYRCVVLSTPGFSASRV